MAYANGQLGLHAPIRVRVERELDGVVHSGIIDATLGRLIFNQQIPQNLGYVDRSDPETMLNLEVSFVTKKKQLGNIIDNCIKKNGITVTAQMLDNIKATGFKYSTKSGISISVYDMRNTPRWRRPKRRSALLRSTIRAASFPMRNVITMLSRSGSRQRMRLPTRFPRDSISSTLLR